MRRALAGAGSSSLWSQSCKPEQKMRNPHFNADQGGTDEMLRCRCRYPWSGVCPDNPNKKCGIRIFMLFQPSMMIFIFAGVSSLVQIWPDSLNKKCGIRIFYLFRRKE